MLNFEDLPDDNAELAGLSVSFPTLKDNSFTSCPVSLKEIAAYVARESGEVVNAEQLKFVRTARVADHDYWLWTLTESDGQRAYVSVSRAGPAVQVGYSPDTYGLTAEQFMLGDYYDVF